MSRKKKKTKFQTLDVTFDEPDTLNLPTKVTEFPPRGYGGRGRGRGGFGSYRDSNPQRDTEFNAPGPWRRGPAAAPPPLSQNRSSFGSSSSFRNASSQNQPSFRNPSSNNRSDNFRIGSGGGRGGDAGGGPRAPPRVPSGDPAASENDTNWRMGNKKEQPQFQQPPRSQTQLNSSSTSSNANPWSKNDDADPPKFGSRQQPRQQRDMNHSSSSKPSSNTGPISRSQFGSKDIPQNNNSFSNLNSSFRNQNRSQSMRENSKFGGSSASKFGGSSASKFGGGGGASKSKFAKSTTTAFGANLVQNNNGGSRLHFAKSTSGRFGNLRNGNNSSESKEESSLKAPQKVVSKRFGHVKTNEISSEPSEQQSYPSLAPKTIEQTKRTEETVEELKRKIKNQNKQTKLKKEKEIKEKEAQLQSNNNKNNKNKNKNKKNQQQEQPQHKNKNKSQPPQKQKQNSSGNLNNKKDKTKSNHISKFNKSLGKKQLEINADLPSILNYGLCQKDLLKRDKKNYEKIAKVLVNNVILNNRGNKLINIDKIFNIIFNLSNLQQESETAFLSLILEIFSLIEQKKSALLVVYYVRNYKLDSKYLIKFNNINSKKVQKEFTDYGLQYIYPCAQEIITTIDNKIKSSVSIHELYLYLLSISDVSSSRIHSNYIIMNQILSYILNNFYFNKCAKYDNKSNESEEDIDIQNINLAKELLINASSKQRGKDLTDFHKIIDLLIYKETDDEKDKENVEESESEEEEEEEEEDGDDEVVGVGQEEMDWHCVLLLSSIVSISSETSYIGLVSLLKIFAETKILQYPHIRSFQQSEDDKLTKNRLTGLRKISDWISECDQRHARLEMERDEGLDSDENGNDDDFSYGGNLLTKPKHKTAADYETVSYVDVE